MLLDEFYERIDQILDDYTRKLSWNEGRNIVDARMRDALEDELYERCYRVSKEYYRKGLKEAEIKEYLRSRGLSC